MFNSTARARLKAIETIEHKLDLNCHRDKPITRCFIDLIISILDRFDKQLNWDFCVFPSGFSREFQEWKEMIETKTVWQSIGSLNLGKHLLNLSIYIKFNLEKLFILNLIAFLFVMKRKFYFIFSWKVQNC